MAAGPRYQGLVIMRVLDQQVMKQDKLRILAIDDDSVDQMQLTRAIRQSGFETEITLASDLTEGLNYVRQSEFDCIFIDFNLPGGNGFDFLREYKNFPSNAPVIIVTSQGDENLAVKAMKMGASDYIPKSLVTAEGIGQSLRYTLRLNEERKSQQKVERALLASERKLETVIERAPIIMFAINCDNEVTLFQGKGIEKLNISTESIIGKKIEEVTKNIPIINTFFEEASKGNEITSSVEFNGRHFEINIIPELKSSECEGGFIGIATDITDHKVNEQELKNTLSVTQEAQKIKEQFMANMSHEIRTPIHGIMSLTNLLLRSKLDDDQSTYLNAIKRSADNLLVIINDILDLSKLEAEKMTFENTVFSLKEILQTTCELFRGKAQEKSISLINPNLNELPDYVKGDPTRLSQIINNLVNNAIKFTNEGSVEITVAVTDSNEKCSMVSLSVRDTGIGIARDKVTHIFDVFTQAGDDITRKFGGTGLGLSIVKKLVELQGGIIEVESTLGEGTVFTVNIPFDIPEPYELDDLICSAEEIGEDVPENLRILIVEDNDINRLVINKLMKDWGASLHNAVNGLEAINMIKSDTYDLVLLDIEMPEMNGYECIKAIRETLAEDKKNIPVLAMTAHATSEEKDKCVRLGMNDYISKPFDPVDLKNKISNLTTPKSNSSEPIANNSTEGNKANPGQRLTNLDYIKELSEDNDSFFHDFITLFLTNTPETLNELTEAMSKKNWEGIRQAAHKVKPSLNYMGMTEARAIAQDIEEYAKNISNLDALPELIEKLSNMCSVAFSELESELKIKQ